ncbi:hypothetical protein D3C80_1177810 [compost metagenome]
MMRECQQRTFGIVNADPPQNLKNFGAPCSGVQPCVKFQWLFKLLTNGHRRIERGHWFLKHHAQPGATQCANFLTFH